MKRKIVVNKKIVIPALLILMLVVIGGVTYAYFTAGVEGNNEAKNAVAETGTMNLVYDGTSAVSLEGALPGAYHEINFSVENTGTLPVAYQIDIIDVINSFVDKNDLVYTLTSTNKGASVDETTLPDTNTSLAPYAVIKTGVKQEYTLTIHFKETGDNQNDNQGKVFSGLIQINNLEESNMLAKETLRNSAILETAEDFTNVPINSGMYITEDDEGDTYYYRGNIDNNYVDLGTTHTEATVGPFIVGENGNLSNLIRKFDTLSKAQSICNSAYSRFGYQTLDDCINDIQDYSKNVGDKLLWRIVRINGDDSIRLISDYTVKEKVEFNLEEVSDYYSRVGYTYNNSAPNVQDGTPSNIKNFLDSWYTSNLSAFDNILVPSSFCNDTSVVNIMGIDWYYYGGNDRIINGNPSLLCPQTTQLYGGKYNLKIGLLTADEANMAGFVYDENESGRKISYLSIMTNDLWHTMTPRYTIPNYNNFQFVYQADYLQRIKEGYAVLSSYGVRPVINLDKNVKISSGDGTELNPYIIEN